MKIFSDDLGNWLDKNLRLVEEFAISMVEQIQAWFNTTFSDYVETVLDMLGLLDHPLYSDPSATADNPGDTNNTKSPKKALTLERSSPSKDQIKGEIYLKQLYNRKDDKEIKEKDQPYALNQVPHIYQKKCTLSNAVNLKSVPFQRCKFCCSTSALLTNSVDLSYRCLACKKEYAIKKIK